MLLALTVIMAFATVVGAAVDLIVIRWHYQDRKRMTDDENAAQLRFNKDEAEIEWLRQKGIIDEAEIERMKNAEIERAAGRWT